LTGGVNNSTFLSVSGLGNASIAGNITSGGNYLGDNYQINGGYRFWGNDSSGIVMFLGADDYSGFGNQILDFGVNVDQQANSGGLPSPTGSYGGGLFRFDLRSGNNSGLSTLNGAVGNAEFYVLLQENGSTGQGNTIFGCTANGILGTKYNILDDGSGNMTIAGNITTSNTINAVITNASGGTSTLPAFHFTSLASVSATSWSGNIGIGLDTNSIIGVVMDKGGLKTINTNGAFSNILDDNSGNMSVSGSLTLGGSLFIKSVSFVVLSAGNGGADITSGYAYIPVQGVCMLLVNGVYNEVDLGQWIFQNQPYAPNNGTGTQNAGSGELFCASGSSVDCIWEIIQIGVG
jgi:hypothetical protein